MTTEEEVRQEKEYLRERVGLQQDGQHSRNIYEDIRHK